ncbi:MAG: dicarboxylate/amino acid:cation symporter [Candidatus Peribacteria bacterium]|nr:MAG: dicarboxylate/amino acid:cation symporter [Candidatus Peribacteria bacterium]
MGELFMTLLKMFLAPLLFFAIINAVLGLGDLKKLGTLGTRTLAYYMLTTTLAIVLGMILMNIFSPGTGVHFKQFENFNSASVEG